MARVELIDAGAPDYGAPGVRPHLERAVYAARIDRLLRVAVARGLDAVIVYGDREHMANLAYLTGFEPRFEEAVLVVGPNRDPVLITGPENQGYAAVSPLELDRMLYPPFGLLGQDRSRTPPLAELLIEAGVTRGWTVGVAGWKYFGPMEAEDPDFALEVPAYLVDALRRLLGERRVVNAGALLMHPSDGLRAVGEIDQLAQFEHAACMTSEAVKRVLSGLSAGVTELEAAGGMGFLGLPFSCHPMLTSGPRVALGLGSPTDRRIELGEPFQTAIGVWGALSCRAARVAADRDDLPEDVRDYVDRLAGPYFGCAADWCEMVGIGVPGGQIDAMVKDRLGDPFFGVTLNPGHLIHYDEWMNTPIYPGSGERLRSGQAIQLDIIPATGTAYGSVNIEDGFALLDDEGREQFQERYPDAWRRIEARRRFMREVLGIHLRPETLPLSNLAGILAPFALSPEKILARR